MIYQVEIGSHANAYIITGGLTGLTEFEPTIILGDDTGVRINVDSKDDNIFTPWIKQSLEFTLIKDTEGQYDDILAGNDNETWGILIENGYLYLSEGYITISDDAILKFKGTLALESYTEQYKKTSVVQFTFHDRIGTMEDDIFYTNTQFKNVADIFACCLSRVVCSDSLYLEWPYTLSSSDDPTEILIDVELFNEKKKIEVLEQVLEDFGMQLIVDYEVKPSINLVDAGTLVIRSVVDFVQQNVVYWGLTQSSYVSSACGREYFTYTGDKLANKFKPRFLLNTIDYPLINNDSSLSLERVGSAIEAKNEIDTSANLIFRGVYERKYVASITYPPDYPIYPDGVTRNEYCPLIYIGPPPPPYDPGGYEDIYDYIIDFLTGVKTREDFINPQVVKLFGNSDYEGLWLSETRGDTSYKEYMAITSDLIELNHAQFTSNKIKLNFKIKASGYKVSPIGETWADLHCNIIMLKDGVAYYNNGSTWYAFTNQDQLLNYNELGIKQLEDVEYDYDFEITSTTSVKIMPLLIMSNTTNVSIFGHSIIKELKITPVFQITDELPESITLTTSLSGNNRKKINIEPKILSAINVKTSGYSIRNVIKDINSNFPTTLTYKSLNQTLLAHLSDQYGWQYDGNRWNLDGTARVFNFANGINIAGQFGLDEKILMFLNGDYDAKRKTLKGKWGQVIITISLSTVIGTRGYKSIVSTGASSIDNWEYVEEYGMTYCLTESGVYTKQSKGTTLTSNSFVANITGLSTATLYYYKAYVVINGITYYGQIRSVSTASVILTTKTGTATNVNINSTGATNIVGYDEVTAFGLAYSLTEDGVYTKQSKGTTLTSNSFTTNITGLSAGTLYYYKAYIEIGAQTFYGNVKSITTVGWVLTLAVYSGSGFVAKSPDNATYAEGASVTLTATEDIGYIFVRWRKNGVSYSLSNPVVITITADATYSAEFIEDL